MMPGLDGFQLLHALREDAQTKTIPILLLSARAGEEATIEGLLAGADDYLVKPFSARELVARVRTMLALSHLRRELEKKQAELLALGADRLRLAMRNDGARDLGDDLGEGEPPLQRAVPGAARAAPGSSLDYEAFLRALHPDDRARVHEAVQRAVDPAGDGTYAIEYRTVSAHEGVERCVAARGHVVDAGAGRPRRFLGTLVDITERAELMAREQKARAAAEEANRLKDEFLATVSHELRTPLNAIMGWASILSGALPNTAKLARGLEVIERNAAAQKAIIEDILDVSRIITGNLRIEPERVDFNAVIEDALDIVLPSAAAKDIEVRCRRGSSPLYLVGDSRRLRQIAWNLLSNAVKFTRREAASRSRSIAPAARCGSGSPTPARASPPTCSRTSSIASARPTARRRGATAGSASAFSIVRHLVELHGGEARAESPGRGQGTTFTIELPPRAHGRDRREPRLTAARRRRRAAERPLRGRAASAPALTDRG